MANPFPGLRPFRTDEDYLFFGRDAQIDALLARLVEKRFLAVVGSSGSGKSSLVKAGLLPALYGGFMSTAGASWRVATLRPGSDPLGNLARALDGKEVFGGAGERHFTETTLRRGPLGLVEAARLGGLGTGESLLVVVDQFEELFRFRETRAAAEDDGAAFVELLLEATRTPGASIWVVLTMRSDFLGDCARFGGLAEAVSGGQYLVPRMSRDQLREAIEGPAAVGGMAVEAALLQQVLEKMGDDQDDLPVLQHALMRTWEDGKELSLERYKKVGAMAEALSWHADEAFEELTKAEQKTAEVMFRRLTEKGRDHRGVRRPTARAELVAVCGDEAAVDRVIEVFGRPGRTFVSMTVDGVVDISHESLMRVWTRLAAWVEAEAESGRRYERLLESAALGGTLKDPELSVVAMWWKRESPGAEWAKRWKNVESRVGVDLAGAEAFLRGSIRRSRLARVMAGVVFLVVLAFGFFAWQQGRVAQRESKRAQLSLAQGLRANAARALKEEDPRAVHYFARAAAVDPRAGSAKTSRMQMVESQRGLSLNTVLQHDSGVLGAVFSSDESLILTWSKDDTARLWPLPQSDQDFPAAKLPLLAEVLAGTTMDDHGNFTALNASDWKSRRAEYIRIAKEHAEVCQYPEANLYRRQMKQWGQ